MKSYLYLGILLLNISLLGSCSTGLAIYEKRCSNRKCCQLAAQKKFHKHVHLEDATHEDRFVATKTIKIDKAKKELHNPKFY